MDAAHTVKHLLEDPVDPLDFKPLSSYYDPLPFSPSSVKDLLDTAAFFKEQAMQANALSAKVIGRHNDRDIDKVMLRLAVEDMADTEAGHETLYNRLKREMHSIWS